jgi:phage gpG-like protein
MNQFNLDKIRASFERVPEEFEGMVAQIGFPSGNNYEDGTPVAYVAAIQEFGAPAVKIPPRPFMQPTVKAKKDEWTKILAKTIPKVVEGKNTAFDALDLVGRVAAADIQETIANVYSPPNAPATIARKGSAKPLIDTGYMLASVTNAVAPADSDFIKA